MALQLRVQVAVVFGLIALTVCTTARPCRTFTIASYIPFPSDSSTVTFFTDIRSFVRADTVSDRGSVGLYGHEFTSRRYRIKDILSAVVALLFGAGCGAVTAAAIYLLWVMYSTRSDSYNSHDDYVEEIKSPEILGYVKVSTKETAA